MIKVLFYIDCLSRNGSIGGAEKVLLNLVNFMDKSRFQITVMTIFPDSKCHLLSGEVIYRSIFKKENKFTHFVYRLETHFGLTYFLHMRDCYDIEAAYLEYGPTKVIASSTNKKAVKLAWIHCDFETAIKDKNAFKKKSQQIYQKIDKVICVCQKVRDSFIFIFGDETGTEVVYNVINDQEIRSKALLDLPGNVKKKEFTLLCVGRFMAQKNYKRLLKTVNRLYEEGYVFHLWILGEGPQRKMIENYIAIHNLTNMVTLYGFQENPYPFIREADLLVCSSDFEGYSTFVTEGLVLGKPILATDCSGMRELLGDSEYGIIVDVNDDAFYQGVKHVLDHKESLIPNLELKAQKRSKDFKLEKLVGDTEEFFTRLVQKE